MISPVRSNAWDVLLCSEGDQPIHDRTQRTWQHLHFFQCKAFVHAPLPRVKYGHCGKVTQVEVPWARPGSGFTLLMDALILTLAQKLPVSAIAKMFGVSEHRIWRAINVHVASARGRVTKVTHPITDCASPKLCRPYHFYSRVDLFQVTFQPIQIFLSCLG